MAQRKNTLSQLGQAVRKKRKELELTQEELGKFAGCGVVFIYELETGKATVRLDKLLAVLSVLGLQLHLEVGKQGLLVSKELITQ